MKQKGQKDWTEGEGQRAELVVIEQERIGVGQGGAKRLIERQHKRKCTKDIGGT